MLAGTVNTIRSHYVGPAFSQHCINTVNVKCLLGEYKIATVLISQNGTDFSSVAGLR